MNIEIKNGGHEPEVNVKHLYARLCIVIDTAVFSADKVFHAPTRDSNKIPTAKPMFLKARQHGETSQNIFRRLTLLETQDGGY